MKIKIKTKNSTTCYPLYWKSVYYRIMLNIHALIANYQMGIIKI